MPICYLTGDATAPKIEGNKIIAHICNDVGGWGKGFVLALSKRWKEPEREFYALYKKGGCQLEEIQLVAVEPDIWVANMVAQRDIYKKDGIPPIRYEALSTCLRKLAAKAKELRASVHMPRIGCGLAGGSWDKVVAIVEKELEGVEVYVYDLR
jgi:O-acetyl-ADP-ribose deacetylase (regulator of RNase III)